MLLLKATTVGSCWSTVQYRKPSSLVSYRGHTKNVPYTLPFFTVIWQAFLYFNRTFHTVVGGGWWDMMGWGGENRGGGVVGRLWWEENESLEVICPITINWPLHFIGPSKNIALPSHPLFGMIASIYPPCAMEGGTSVWVKPPYWSVFPPLSIDWLSYRQKVMIERQQQGMMFQNRNSFFQHFTECQIILKPA